MATPAQLVKAMSDATGVPLATLVDIDRKLVKGKLRTKGGRGVNAARMTALDAARLLTAVLASPQANASADAVERYAKTRPDKARSSDKLFRAVKLNDLAALPTRHSFVDALAGLIASASTGSLAKLILHSPLRWLPRIEVCASTRATRGRIRISGLPDGRTASLEYAAVPTEAKPTRFRKMGRSGVALAGEGAGDLEQSGRITERTVLMVAELLARESRYKGQ
jgi:hypothetical protein